MLENDIVNWCFVISFYLCSTNIVLNDFVFHVFFLWLINLESSSLNSFAVTVQIVVVPLLGLLTNFTCKLYTLCMDVKWREKNSMIEPSCSPSVIANTFIFLWVNLKYVTRWFTCIHRRSYLSGVLVQFLLWYLITCFTQFTLKISSSIASKL